MQDWKARYEALLDEGYQANPPDPPPVIKKGRRKQSAARNLLDRLSKHQEAVLLFLDNFAVPFDNSLAERDIRAIQKSLAQVKDEERVWGRPQRCAFGQGRCAPQANPSERGRYC